MAILPRFRFDSQIGEEARGKDAFPEGSMMSDQFQMGCPRCGVGRLIGWDELTEEEREVVRRLPASAGYSLDERQAMHRWCTKCWYEEMGNAPADA